MADDRDREGCIIDEITIGLQRISPKSGKKFYTPDVPISCKPLEGMIFNSIEHAFEFYKKYATTSGFVARRGSQYCLGKVIKLKYLVCSKEGHKPTKSCNYSDNNMDNGKKIKTRNRPTQRTGCLAHVVLKSDDGVIFKVNKFVEEHNHGFVAQEDIHMLPSCRKLNYEQMQMMCSLSKHNIGPVRAFNIMRTKYGGFDQVGITSVDCKNFKKQLNLFVGEYDADMVVSMLLKKKEFVPDFSFEYTKDNKDQLTGLFWADGHAKKNYIVFGDVVSFDATFRTNKYKMVFVPFTGIDNHHCNISFGAALLGSESITSYKWLLECFTNAFGMAPKVVVTDQDAAIKQAVESVWPSSRHRLCMWHIMTKVSDKVGTALCNNDEFKSRLCNIVWTDSVSPEDFDREWLSIMDDYELSNVDWFGYMFEIRDMWIPAFYRDEPMSGLMRTTSRSESENHYFGQVSNCQLTLLEFFTHFDTAMEAQRHMHRKNDHVSRNTNADLWTDYTLEEQAHKIYTRSIFFDVQEEIYDSIHNCLSVCTSQSGDFTKFLIKDLKAYGNGYLEVLYGQDEDEITVRCSCKRFECYGLLCRHCFYVLRLCGVKVFPEKYITRRWTKDVVPNMSNNCIINPHILSGINPEVDNMVRDIMTSSEYIVNKLVTDMRKLSIFRDTLKNLMEQTDVDTRDRPLVKQKDIVSSFVPNNEELTSDVRVPSGIRNKGSGSHKRFKSKREQAISRMGKRSRGCHACGQAGHDRRTCPALRGPQKT